MNASNKGDVMKGFLNFFLAFQKYAKHLQASCTFLGVQNI